jgi:hypothetical protein
LLPGAQIRLSSALQVGGAIDLDGSLLARIDAELLGGELVAERLVVSSGARLTIGGGVRLIVTEFISEGEVVVDGDVTISGRFVNRGTLRAKAQTKRAGTSSSLLSANQFATLGSMLINVFPKSSGSAPVAEPVAVAAPVSEPVADAAPVAPTPIAEPVAEPPAAPEPIAEAAPIAEPVAADSPVESPIAAPTGASDLVIATQTAEFDGIMTVNGVSTLNPGDSVVVVTYGSHEGQFSSVTSDSTSCEETPTTSYAPTSLNILITGTCGNGTPDPNDGTLNPNGLSPAAIAGIAVAVATVVAVIIAVLAIPKLRRAVLPFRDRMASNKAREELREAQSQRNLLRHGSKLQLQASASSDSIDSF